MYTQELLVHKCSQGKAVEGVHTCVIHPLWILNSTCHGGKQGRERRACQVKQHSSQTLGQCARLGRKGSPKCQKTSQTHFKNSTISQSFYKKLKFFATLSESNRNSSDMWKYQEGQKSDWFLYQAREHIQVGVCGWWLTWTHNKQLFRKNNSILLPLCTENYRPNSLDSI